MLLVLPLLLSLALGVSALLPLAGRVLKQVQLLGAVLYLFCLVLFWWRRTLPPVGHWLSLDALNLFAVTMVLAVAATATTVTAAQLPVQGAGRSARLHIFWLALFITSLLWVALSGNLAISWLAIEMTTLTSAVLVGQAGTRTSIEAAWKYAVLCSLGLVVALFGIALLASLMPSSAQLASLDWPTLLQVAPHMPPGPVQLAFLLGLVGLGTKIGFAPLHTWLPDAHSEAPGPVSGLLSGVLLAGVLLTLVRLAKVAGLTLGTVYTAHLLLGAGLLTLAVATPFLIVQHDLKRMLAYSSMEQIGLMAVGFGLGSQLAVTAALLQMLVHALVKSTLFMAAGEVAHLTGTKQLLRLRGLLVTYPMFGWVLLAGVLTLIGLPPFGLFWSEVGILLTGFASPYRWLTVAVLALLGLGATGLMHHVGNALYGQGTRRQAHPSRWVAGALFGPLVLTVVVGTVTPGPVSSVLARATAWIVGGGQ